MAFYENAIERLHEAGLFLPLATVSDLISFEKYVEYKTSHFQPDSDEEQALRTEAAYIELLGKLV